jgi:hypothetical protein
MLDKQTYISQWNKASINAKGKLRELHTQLKKNGGLWLIDGLHERGQGLANEVYHTIRKQTTNQAQ